MKYLIDAVHEEVKPRLAENTIKLLSSTRLPLHAYVVYQIPKIRHYGNGEREITTGICIVNVEDQPNQICILDDLSNRNGVYCCHGNFPRHDDKDPKRAAKHRLYNDPDGSNPWDNVNAYCQKLINQSREVFEIESKLKSELDSLKKELEKEKKKAKKEEKIVVSEVQQ